MSNKTQNNKKQASEYEREKKHAKSDVVATSLTGEMKGLWKGLLGAGQDAATGSITSFSEQVIGSNLGSTLSEGHAVSLRQTSHVEQVQAEKKTVVTSEHMEYFRTVNNADRLGETATERQMRQAVDQIRLEIQKLMKTSKLVERTV